MRGAVLGDGDQDLKVRVTVAPGEMDPGVTGMRPTDKMAIYLAMLE